MRRAAIAIGSNSTRMLCADVNGSVLTNCVRGREETRLFLGLDASGSICPERLEATAHAVARLAAQARQAGAESIDLLATSATRDARNGWALGERIRALCGLRLRIISGQEEANLAFRAVSNGKRRLVMDIGGGSTEWTLGEENRVEWAVSMQLGASRLLTMCPINSPADAQRALSIAAGIMAPQAEKLRAFAPAPLLIGMGGSCTTSAAMSMCREAHGEQVEGYVVTRAAAAAQLAMLSAMTLDERRAVPGLPPARALHMPHGLCIILAALDACGFDRLTVSGKTNLDGYLASLSAD